MKKTAYILCLLLFAVALLVSCGKDGGDKVILPLYITGDIAEPTTVKDVAEFRGGVSVKNLAENHGFDISGEDKKISAISYDGFEVEVSAKNAEDITVSYSNDKGFYLESETLPKNSRVKQIKAIVFKEKNSVHGFLIKDKNGWRKIISMSELIDANHEEVRIDTGSAEKTSGGESYVAGNYSRRDAIPIKKFLPKGVNEIVLHSEDGDFMVSSAGKLLAKKGLLNEFSFMDEEGRIYEGVESISVYSEQNQVDEILMSAPNAADFSERTISFRTGKISGAPVLTLESGGGEREIPAVKNEGKELAKKDKSHEYWSVALGSLSAGKHSYKITTADSETDEIVFEVSGEKDLSEDDILFFGDIQSKKFFDGDDVSVQNLISTAHEKTPSAALGIFAGDLIENGDSPENFADSLSAMSPVFSKIPVYAVPGNHEVTPYVNDKGRKPKFFLEVFDLPKNGPEGFAEEFYRLDIGGLSLVFLSSNYMNKNETAGKKGLAKIARWIKRNTKQKNIVVMHHPVVALADDEATSGIIEHWLPIFKEGKTRTVLSGHNHALLVSDMDSGSDDGKRVLRQVIINSSEKVYDETELASAASTAGDFYENAGLAYARLRQKTGRLSIYDRSGEELYGFSFVR